jgi:hypothetical protein
VLVGKVLNTQGGRRRERRLGSHHLCSAERSGSRYHLSIYQPRGRIWVSPQTFGCLPKSTLPDPYPPTCGLSRQCSDIFPLPLRMDVHCTPSDFRSSLLNDPRWCSLFIRIGAGLWKVGGAAAACTARGDGGGVAANARTPPPKQHLSTGRSMLAATPVGAMIGVGFFAENHINAWQQLNVEVRRASFGVSGGVAFCWAAVAAVRSKPPTYVQSKNTSCRCSRGEDVCTQSHYLLHCRCISLLLLTPFLLTRCHLPHYYHQSTWPLNWSLL